MKILIRKGKWLIGQDSVHIVVDIKGILYYTDVKSEGTNFKLVEDLPIHNTNIDLELSIDQLKEIENIKWNKDLELVNYYTGLNYSVSDYKNNII